MNKPLTPAQSYAQNAVEALDDLIAAESDAEYHKAYAAKLVMERPKTLRCALAAYLYKSQMQSLNRR